MPDDRDDYKPKHRTPAAGVPARLSTESERRSALAERRRQERLRDMTPVDMPIQEATHRRLTQAVEIGHDIDGRLFLVEDRLAVLELKTEGLVRADQAMTLQLDGIKTQVAALSPKVDTIHTEVLAVQRERLAREERIAERKRSERAEERAADEKAEERKAKERSDRRASIAKTLVPTIVALGGLVAGIIAAYNTSGH